MINKQIINEKTIPTQSCIRRILDLTGDLELAPQRPISIPKKQFMSWLQRYDKATIDNACRHLFYRHNIYIVLSWNGLTIRIKEA